MSVRVGWQITRRQTLPTCPWLRMFESISSGLIVLPKGDRVSKSCFFYNLLNANITTQRTESHSYQRWIQVCSAWLTQKVTSALSCYCMPLRYDWVFMFSISVLNKADKQAVTIWWKNSHLSFLMPPPHNHNDILSLTSYADGAIN